MKTAAALAVAAFAVGAKAITFSTPIFSGPPQLLGTIGTDTTFNLGGNGQDIDFTFLKAAVGDSLPLRAGTITITFTAKSDKPIVLDKLNLTFAALLKGSGHIRFVEIVEDLEGSGMLASFSKDYFAGTLGDSQTLVFSRPSSYIKIKKTIFLDAFDTDAVDIAALGFVEQKLEVVPEPATLAGFGLALAGLAARRRRK